MGDQECGQGDQLYHKASELKLQNSTLYARAPSKTPAMHHMVICFVNSQKWDIVTTVVVEITWSLSWFSTVSILRARMAMGILGSQLGKIELGIPLVWV